MQPTNANRSLENIAARSIRARATGRWTEWRWHQINGAPGSTGWAKEFSRIAENGVFAVSVRDVPTEWGTVQHAMITTPMPPLEPSWQEMQRIKDSLFGRERVAVEVFPPRSELVDGADAYHLWILPAGFALPFSIGRNS